MFAWMCMSTGCGALVAVDGPPPTECPECGCPFFQKQPVRQWLCANGECGASIIALSEVVPKRCGLCGCPYLQETAEPVARKRPRVDGGTSDGGPRLPPDFFPVIISFMEPKDAWDAREVSRLWRDIVDRVHWPVVPQKVDAREWTNDPLGQVARVAMTHVRRVLSQAPTVALTGTAGQVQGLLAERYNALSGGKDIANNCLAVFDNGEATQFVLNFFSWEGTFERMFEDVSAPDLSTTVHGALDVMRKHPWMHAEIRVLHEGEEPESIDKAMCVFCAATFQETRGETYPSHSRTLQWYTFSTLIFSTRERVRAVFGDEFAVTWFSSGNADRRTLLGYCVALTNPTLWLPRGRPCQRCGTPTVKRTGRNGDFWACPKWPTCH